jgi:hypothetical protein
MGLQHIVVIIFGKTLSSSTLRALANRAAEGGVVAPVVVV